VNTFMPSATVVVARPYPPVDRPSKSTRIADAGWRLVAMPFAPVRVHAAANATQATKSAQATQSTKSARYAANAKQAAPPRAEPR
jgi:hypothetical protein